MLIHNFKKISIRKTSETLVMSKQIHNVSDKLINVKSKRKVEKIWNVIKKNDLARVY